MATLGLNNPFVQNPFLQSLSSLLYANPAAAPSWAGHLSNKAVASMWNYNDAKRLQQPHEEEEVNIVFILTNIVPTKNSSNFDNNFESTSENFHF